MRATVTPPARPRPAQPWHWAWAAVAAAVLAYLPTLRYGFVFDDFDAVVRNPMLRGWAALPHTLAVWQHEVVHFRPIRYLSLALDWNLGGGAPWVFHASNVLLHAGCAGLLGAVVLRMLGSPAQAQAAALLFAVLPSHAATVAYVSGRKDLLATGFYLLAVLAFLSFRKSGRTRHAVAAYAAGVCCALSKETAATLPVALLALDAWLTARERPEAAGSPRRALALALRDRRAWYLAWLLLLAFFLVYVLWIWPATRVPRDQWGDLLTHLGTASRVWATAFLQLLFPWRTVPDRLGLITVGAGWSAGSLAGLALTAALLAAGWRLRRSRPAAAAGIGFLLLSWLPTSGIVPIAEVFAEHYLYLPSVGVCLALGALLAPAQRRDAGKDRGTERAASTSPRRWIAVCGAVALAAWSVALSRAWRDERSVWEASLRANPHSYRAAVNLSGVYLASGRAAEADSLARRAVELAPDAPVATAQLVSTLIETGKHDAAIDLARRGLDRFPHSGELTEALGVALVRAGKPAEAAPVLAALVARPAASPYLLGMYGQALVQLGESARAESVLTRAVAADATYSQAWTNLGLARWELGRTEEAEAALRRAVELAPSDPDPHNNLAVLLFRSGRVQEALQHARMSVRLGRPLHPEFERALEDAVGQLRRDTKAAGN